MTHTHQDITHQENQALENRRGSQGTRWTGVRKAGWEEPPATDEAETGKRAGLCVSDAKGESASGRHVQKGRGPVCAHGRPTTLS